MLKLNNFDVDDFLQNYWQQKPLIIRNALPGFESPLSPEELAGLACEQEIESRLIQGKDKTWQLKHGPLSEADFNTLPAQDWTLLVQAVDHWIPEVSAILEYFRFIPSWRIDDIMVSYAADGGSVGPHYDNYDVFLVQGLGQRLWRLGQYCHEDSELIPHEQLKILNEFSQQEEQLLNPGDILYIPPKLAHWGIAQGQNCMTYSVGFRAPSHREVLSHFCDFQLEQIDSNQRYQDKQLNLQQNSAQIAPQAITEIANILKTLSCDKQAIAQWFGQYMTEPKYPHLHEDSADDLDLFELKQLLKFQDTVYKNPSSRFAYYQANGTESLFIDGKSYDSSELSAKLIEQLCNQQQWPAADVIAWLDQQNAALLLNLFNHGILFIEDYGDD